MLSVLRKKRNCQKYFSLEFEFEFLCSKITKTRKISSEEGKEGEIRKTSKVAQKFMNLIQSTRNYPL